ncbi:nitroreductase [Aquimarina atlantica]|uniref:Nitroreductase n=1 Tax=Aquimarina atlantica TaxID=1317122 RepID=A0A023BQJ8_9FLAO|nr:NAD(P)H-dependent oxidoreductase [Aquimarina atlantica]EZH72345.1 nitroreductase [Aquimarina atlantica]
MEFIKNQNWRYATKKFDKSKKVSIENMELLKQAVRLSVSSYGLQLYKILIIENQEIRKKLQPVSWNQSQITDASHLFVFCNYTKIKPLDIDNYLNLTAISRALKLEDLKGYGDFIKMKLAEKSIDEQLNWSKCQTYIALANLLSACAELKIDSCPMEGFEAQQYNKILGLTKQGLNASVIATIGYRSTEDTTQHLSKVRKPIQELFKNI